MPSPEAGRSGPGGVFALFAGRRVGYSWNTRTAIRAAVDLLGLVQGDEVLAPGWNCGSELDPLVAAGLSVRLFPVGPGGTVDPDAVRQRIGPRTRAVYLTHYFGLLQPATAALRRICDDHGLRLIEDLALALLSGAHPAGGQAGDVAVFCFYKFFPVVGGGALAVNRPGLADPVFPRSAPAAAVAKALLRRLPLAGPALRRLRRAAAAPAAVPQGISDIPAHYYFDRGLAGRRLAAPTARALARVDIAAEIALRRARYARFLDRLQDLRGAVPLYPDLPADAVPLGMPLLVGAAQRDRLAAALAAEGIEATPWWAGEHRGLDFTGQAVARDLKARVLFLPAHPGIPEAGIDRMAARLQALLRQEA
jgi:dTDP-4-amino-4,6-dideoxygalactose transaminase